MLLPASLLTPGSGQFSAVWKCPGEGQVLEVLQCTCCPLGAVVVIWCPPDIVHYLVMGGG